MSERQRPAAAVNGSGGQEGRERERENESSCVKSICTPLGVSTNYCLISRTEAPFH